MVRIISVVESVDSADAIVDAAPSDVVDSDGDGDTVLMCNTSSLMTMGHH